MNSVRDTIESIVGVWFLRCSKFRRTLLISVLFFFCSFYLQGADGVRGLKGNKGEKVILECVRVTVSVWLRAVVCVCAGGG